MPNPFDIAIKDLNISEQAMLDGINAVGFRMCLDAGRPGQAVGIIAHVKDANKVAYWLVYIVDDPTSSQHSGSGC